MAEMPSDEPRCTNLDGYSDVARIVIVGKAGSFVPSNRIDVDAGWARRNGFLNRELVLVGREGGSPSVECCLVATSFADDGEDDGGLVEAKAQTTLHVMERLGIDAGDRACVSIRKLSNALLVKRVAVQRIDKVREGSIAVSDDLYHELKEIEEGRASKRRRFYRLNHLATGALYYVPFDKIERDPSLAAQTVRLSRYQRMLLNLHAAPCVMDGVLEDLVENAEIDQATKQSLFDRYARDALLVPDSYDEQQSIMRNLRSCGYDTLQITESAFEEPSSLWAKVPKAISGFMVGNSSILLKSCRPFANDEERDIVRLSHSAMVHLGIDESDKVILRHGKAKARARALPIDSMERIMETNTIAREADIDPLVGIPASMRRSLGVCDLDEAVLVERDTGYLFRKNLNAQFMPVLLFFLAIVQTGYLFGTVVLGYSLLASVVGLPIIAFIMFSEQRAKVK